MKHESVLATLGDDELLHRLCELLRGSRRTESELVAHIGEVDRRRLYAREASPSMFVYCTRRLHLSGPEAYLRITAARAARKHPTLLVMLADGRLHLSGIAKLAPYLTRDNRDSVLARATHRSKREIEELVAELAPRPDVPSRVRRLPARVRPDDLPLPAPGPRPGDLRAVTVAGGLDEPDRAMGVEFPWVPIGRTGAHEHDPAREELPPHAATTAIKAHGPVELRPDGVRGRFSEGEAGSSGVVVTPLAPSRYKVQFTASAELKDKLERLRALLRFEVPDGDLGAVVDRAVTETLERLEARRYGRKRAPREVTSTTREASSDTRHSTSCPNHAATLETLAQRASAHSRYIPAAVRRAVHERDGGRCHYTDETGRRCPERHRLEYHHRLPFGVGGGHALENVSLMCRAHNLYLAEQDYGRKAMASYLRPREERAGPESGTV